MCGIAGFIGKGTTNDLEKMIAAIQHRGPDRQKVELVGTVGLAQARLAIIDLSEAGTQPMWSADRSVGLVFNGEIYNYQELRDNLVATGKYTFASQTDTEVTIYAYKEYGLDCFAKMNGMFAIALYDFSANKLILARDRMGKKPLYYGRFGDTFLFGSELKALMAHPAFQKKLNIDAVNSYFLYEYVPTPQCIWQGVNKLEPASYAVYDGATIVPRTYWNIDMQPRSIDFATALRKLDTKISDAVRSRLIADVPLGVFLSGGLDSSTVAYYAKKHSTSPVKTFSIGFTEASFDESEYARRVASILGTDHHHQTLSVNQSLEVIDHVYSNLDEPIADQSILPTFLLSRFTREYVTVALGGDGGDELFAGYPTFQAEKMARIYKLIPRAIRTRFIEALIPYIPVSNKYFSLDFIARRFVGGFGVHDHHRHHAWMGNFDNESRRKLFLPEVWSQLSGQNEYAHLDALVKQTKYTDLSSLFLYLYQRTYMLDNVLVKVDRASMMNALEVRAPLLDYKVVDFANSLPFSFKLHGWTTKYILKKLMEDKLPRDIVYRKKKGFAVPMARWLRHELRAWCDEVLSREAIESTGIFDYAFVNKLKQDHYDGKVNNYKQLWTIIVFMLWWKRFGS